MFRNILRILSPVHSGRRSTGRGANQLNRVHLIGRLTGDVYCKYTPRGCPVTYFRTATNDRNTAQFHELVGYRQDRRLCGRADG